MRLVDGSECALLQRNESLVTECDLAKDARTKQGICASNRDVECHLKRHTVVLKRYGHFEKVLCTPLRSGALRRRYVEGDGAAEAHDAGLNLS